MKVSLANRKGSIDAMAQPPRLLGSLSRWIALCLTVVLTIIFFSMTTEDWLTIVNFTLIAAIASLGLNVLSDYTNQVSLGMAFFMSIGAYTATVLDDTPPTTPLDPFGL